MIVAEELKNSILQSALKGGLTKQLETDSDVKNTLEMIKQEKAFFLKKIGNSTQKIPEIQEESIPFEIPDNWCWVALGEVSKRIHYGYTASASEIGNSKLLRITDIQNNSVNWETVPYCSPSEKELIKYQLYNRDIMIARTGGTIGKTYIVNSLKETAVFASYLIRVIPSNHINEQYLKYYTESPIYWNQLRNSSNGTGQPNVNSKALSRLLMPLPPIEEQQRIVDRINEIMPEVEKYKKTESQLEAIRKAFPINLIDSIIQAGIQGKLTEQLEAGSSVDKLLNDILVKRKEIIKIKQIKNEKSLEIIEADELPFKIPDNWRWIRLGDICSKIGAGSTPRGGAVNYVHQGVPFIREQNVYNDGLRYEGIVYIPEEINEKKKGSIVMPGDVLLNITGGSIGRCALVPDDFEIGNVNQHVLIIRNVEPRLKEYIHMVLTSPYIQSLIMSKQKGDKEGLSATSTKKFPIPIPPIEEQQRIVDRIKDLLLLCNIIKNE